MPYFDIASTYTMANGGDEFLEEGVTYKAFKVRVIRSPKIIKLLWWAFSVGRSFQETITKIKKKNFWRKDEED